MKPDQVVVVNGGDATATGVVERVLQRSRSAGELSVELKVINIVNKNLAASRNAGLPHCTGDIIGMTDDDAEVMPDWVKRHKSFHASHPEAGGVGGAVIAADQSSLLSRIADQVTFPNYPKVAQVRSVPGVNVSYKRRVVEQVGLQDETLFRGEDVDYNWRVKQLGYEIYYDPAIQVIHHHRPTVKAFLSQHYMYGRAYYLVRRKWPEMYCVYPHSVGSLKDILKGLNFIAAAFYEPLSSSARIEGKIEKVLTYLTLSANQLAWRFGMIRQRLAGDK